MKSTRRFTSGWIFFAMTAVIGSCLSVFPTRANAQGSPGQNAVYNSSNGIVGSYAFVDASTFAASPPPPSRNFCGVPTLSSKTSTNLPFTLRARSFRCARTQLDQYEHDLHNQSMGQR